MIEKQELTEKEMARLRSATENMMGALQVAAAQHQVDIEQLGALLVQKIILEMRMVSPGDEWRKMVLDACARAIDQADEVLKSKPTHGMPHAAQ